MDELDGWLAELADVGRSLFDLGPQARARMYANDVRGDLRLPRVGCVPYWRFQRRRPSEYRIGDHA